MFFRTLMKLGSLIFLLSCWGVATAAEIPPDAFRSANDPQTFFRDAVFQYNFRSEEEYNNALWTLFQSLNQDEQFRFLYAIRTLHGQAVGVSSFLNAVRKNWAVNESRKQLLALMPSRYNHNNGYNEARKMILARPQTTEFELQAFALWAANVGDFVTAERIFRKAFDQAKSFSAAFALLKFYLQTDDREALDTMPELLKSCAKTSSDHLEIVLFLLSENKLDEAEEQLVVAENIRPADERVPFARAAVLASRQKWNAAIPALAKLLRSILDQADQISQDASPEQIRMQIPVFPAVYGRSLTPYNVSFVQYPPPKLLETSLFLAYPSNPHAVTPFRTIAAAIIPPPEENPSGPLYPARAHARISSLTENGARVIALLRAIQKKHPEQLPAIREALKENRCRFGDLFFRDETSDALNVAFWNIIPVDEVIELFRANPNDEQLQILLSFFDASSSMSPHTAQMLVLSRDELLRIFLATRKTPRKTPFLFLNYFNSKQVSEDEKLALVSDIIRANPDFKQTNPLLYPWLNCNKPEKFNELLFTKLREAIDNAQFRDELEPNILSSVLNQRFLEEQYDDALRIIEHILSLPQSDSGKKFSDTLFRKNSELLYYAAPCNMEQDFNACIQQAFYQNAMPPLILSGMEAFSLNLLPLRNQNGFGYSDTAFRFPPKTPPSKKRFDHKRFHAAVKNWKGDLPPMFRAKIALNAGEKAEAEKIIDEAVSDNSYAGKNGNNKDDSFFSIMFLPEQEPLIDTTPVPALFNALAFYAFLNKPEKAFRTAERIYRNAELPKQIRVFAGIEVLRHAQKAGKSEQVGPVMEFIMDFMPSDEEAVRIFNEFNRFNLNKLVNIMRKERKELTRSSSYFQRLDYNFFHDIEKNVAANRKAAFQTLSDTIENILYVSRLNYHSIQMNLWDASISRQIRQDSLRGANNRFRLNMPPHRNNHEAAELRNLFGRTEKSEAILKEWYKESKPSFSLFKQAQIHELIFEEEKESLALFRAAYEKDPKQRRPRIALFTKLLDTAPEEATALYRANPDLFEAELRDGVYGSIHLQFNQPDPQIFPLLRMIFAFRGDNFPDDLTELFFPEFSELNMRLLTQKQTPQRGWGDNDPAIHNEIPELFLLLDARARKNPELRAVAIKGALATAYHTNTFDSPTLLAETLELLEKNNPLLKNSSQFWTPVLLVNLQNGMLSFDRLQTLEKTLRTQYGDAPANRIRDCTAVWQALFQTKTPDEFLALAKKYLSDTQGSLVGLRLCEIIRIAQLRKLKVDILSLLLSDAVVTGNIPYSHSPWGLCLDYADSFYSDKELSEFFLRITDYFDREYAGNEQDISEEHPLSPFFGFNMFYGNRARRSSKSSALFGNGNFSSFLPSSAAQIFYSFQSAFGNKLHANRRFQSIVLDFTFGGTQTAKMIFSSFFCHYSNWNDPPPLFPVLLKHKAFPDAADFSEEKLALISSFLHYGGGQNNIRERLAADIRRHTGKRSFGMEVFLYQVEETANWNQGNEEQKDNTKILALLERFSPELLNLTPKQHAALLRELIPFMQSSRNQYSPFELFRLLRDPQIQERFPSTLQLFGEHIANLANNLADEFINGGAVDPNNPYSSVIPICQLFDVLLVLDSQKALKLLLAARDIFSAQEYLIHQFKNSLRPFLENPQAQQMLSDHEFFSKEEIQQYNRQLERSRKDREGNP